MEDNQANGGKAGTRGGGVKGPPLPSSTTDGARRQPRGPMKEFLAIRTQMGGSTRGAFVQNNAPAKDSKPSSQSSGQSAQPMSSKKQYGGAKDSGIPAGSAAPPKTLKKKKSARKSDSKSSPPAAAGKAAPPTQQPVPQQGISLADAASMALSSLEDGLGGGLDSAMSNPANPAMGSKATSGATAKPEKEVQRPLGRRGMLQSRGSVRNVFQSPEQHMQRKQKQESPPQRNQKLQQQQKDDPRAQQQQQQKKMSQQKQHPRSSPPGVWTGDQPLPPQLQQDQQNLQFQQQLQINAGPYNMQQTQQQQPPPSAFSDYGSTAYANASSYGPGGTTPLQYPNQSADNMMQNNGFAWPDPSQQQQSDHPQLANYGSVAGGAGGNFLPPAQQQQMRPPPIQVYNYGSTPQPLMQPYPQPMQNSQQQSQWQQRSSPPPLVPGQQDLQPGQPPYGVPPQQQGAPYEQYSYQAPASNTPKSRQDEINMFAAIAQEGFEGMQNPNTGVQNQGAAEEATRPDLTPTAGYGENDMQEKETDVKVEEEKKKEPKADMLTRMSALVAGGFGGLFGADDDAAAYDDDEYLLGPGGASREVGLVTFAFRSMFFDPINPEFTSLQQFSWAVILGMFMGMLTAYWGQFIEFCIDIVWKEIPETLMELGVFTELDGWFPLPHYMWICPAIFGGILSYATAILPVPIPGQNEWIESLHRQGVMDSTTFLYTLVLSTGGMASGLSLGPELPLVLLSGMVGSFLGKLTHQSVLSARVMNLTAGAAAIGGFFGFPMAGALFVLEIPHRMGLQYFEALSPATIASIVAVLVNRICTGNDVTGYFNYPFLSPTLPSRIFYVAVLYGLIGSLIGVIYTEGCLKLKKTTHDLFHYHEPSHDENVASPSNDIAKETIDVSMGAAASEKVPLVGSVGKMNTGQVNDKLEQIKAMWKKVTHFGIKREPVRAAVVGTIAGIITGVVCMFLPHSLFWGEAQLQTLLDKGRTPLPVFGEPGEATSDLVAYGHCMISRTREDIDLFDESIGFSLGCSAIIVVAKIFVIGLSLGTGIVGGHFWGPLYVAAAAANLFIDAMRLVSMRFGIGATLCEYPCVALLCIMGSTHVVTFRAHTAIMLILTLTISTFSDSSGSNAPTGGDYSAVFPLLVVSCFVSLMVTRSTIFYKQQRCRGDIIASPEVLCEPGKEGQPEYPMPDVADGSTDSFYDDDDADGSLDPSWVNGSQEEVTSMVSVSDESASQGQKGVLTVPSEVTRADIERDFESIGKSNGQEPKSTSRDILGCEKSETHAGNGSDANIDNVAGSLRLESTGKPEEQSTPPTAGSSPTSIESGAPPRVPGSSIDDLLAVPIERIKPRSKGIRKSKHRTSHSTSDVMALAGSSVGGSHGARPRISSFDRADRAEQHGSGGNRQRANSRDRSNASTPTNAILTKVNSFGELGEFQPSLMNQARMRASSVVRNPTPPMIPKMGHRRKSSGGSSSHQSSNVSGDVAGAMSQEDIERAFSSVQNQANLEVDSIATSRMLTSSISRRRVGTDPSGF